MCLTCFALARRRGRGGVPRGGPAPFPGEEGPLPWPDGRLAGGALCWTGVAGLRLGLDGFQVALDPFVSRRGPLRVVLGRPAIDRRLVRALLSGLDGVFVGHAHYDHAMDLPEVARASPRALIHAGPTVVTLCRRLGVPRRRLVTLEDGARVRVGPFEVEAVEARHGRVPVLGRIDRLEMPSRGVPATPFRYPRGEVRAWRVEAAGRAFHVQGSAGIEEGALARQRPADALVACLAARAGTPRYLERLGERLRPGVLVPCHHDDFFRPLSHPPRPVPGLDWAGFLREAAGLSRAYGTRLFVPPRLRTVAW